MEHCCGGITTLSPQHLDDYQQVPWGTHAWEASYGRRQLVESANSRIKRKLNGDKGLVCAFGRAAMTLGVAAMIAALNMEVTLGKVAVDGGETPLPDRRVVDSEKHEPWFQVGSGALEPPPSLDQPEVPFEGPESSS